VPRASRSTDEFLNVAAAYGDQVDCGDGMSDEEATVLTVHWDDPKWTQVRELFWAMALGEVVGVWVPESGAHVFRRVE
jgi:hypothetical protein